jgi:hypothetical protein
MGLASLALVDGISRKMTSNICPSHFGDMKPVQKTTELFHGTRTEHSQRGSLRPFPSRKGCLSASSTTAN